MDGILTSAIFKCNPSMSCESMADKFVCKRLTNRRQLNLSAEQRKLEHTRSGICPLSAKWFIDTGNKIGIGELYWIYPFSMWNIRKTYVSDGPYKSRHMLLFPPLWLLIRKIWILHQLDRLKILKTSSRRHIGKTTFKVGLNLVLSQRWPFISISPAWVPPVPIESRH